MDDKLYIILIGILLVLGVLAGVIIYLACVIVHFEGKSAKAKNFEQFKKGFVQSYIYTHQEEYNEAIETDTVDDLVKKIEELFYEVLDQ